MTFSAIALCRAKFTYPGPIAFGEAREAPRGSGRPLSIPMGIAKDTCGHFRAPRGQSYAIVLPVSESVSTITKSTSTGAK